MPFVRVKVDWEKVRPTGGGAASAPRSGPPTPSRLGTAIDHGRAGLAVVAVHAILGWVLVARLGGGSESHPPPEPSITFLHAISTTSGSEVAPPKPDPTSAQLRPTPMRELDSSQPVALEPQEWSTVDLPPISAPSVQSVGVGGQAGGFDPYANASFFGVGATAGVPAGESGRPKPPPCEDPYMLDDRVLADVVKAAGPTPRSVGTIAAVVGRGGVVLSVEGNDASRPAAYADVLVGRRLAPGLQEHRLPCRIIVPLGGG